MPPSARIEALSCSSRCSRAATISATKPECGDVYKSRVDEHDFDVFEGGDGARIDLTGLTVTQRARWANG